MARRSWRRPARRIAAALLVLALAAGASALAEGAEIQKGEHAAGGAAAAGSGGKAAAESSACATRCFEAAKQLGYERVTGDSTACFLPDKSGRQLGTADCCAKANQLLGASGPMANCMCCPEFVQAMKEVLPFGSMGTTAEGYTDRLSLCGVPMHGGGAACASAPAPAPSPAMPPSRRRRLAQSPGAPPSPPLVTTFNLTGLYPWFGFDSRFDFALLGEQGRAAVAAGKVKPVRVSGASQLYNDYIAGFLAWIDRASPKYDFAPRRNSPSLPPLPEQYKADVAWVASLRRGPYPDLIKGRDPAYSPKRTDPLQNGEVSNLSPGPAFSGKRTPVGKTSGAFN